MYHVLQMFDVHVVLAMGRRLDSPCNVAQFVSAVEGLATNESHFGMGTASFHVDNSHIRVNRALLVGREEQFQIDGSVDFAGQLDLRVLSMPRVGDPSTDSEAGAANAEWVLGGTLAMPQLNRQMNTAGPGAASARSRPVR